MVIVLSRDEKRTFYSFLSLYLGSSLLLVSIINWLFYSSISKQYYKLDISKMQTQESIVSHKIIQAHMKKEPLNLRKLLNINKVKYGLYNSFGKIIYTQIQDSVDFSKKDYKTSDGLFYIGHGTFGHLGVSYVVIKKTGLKHKQEKLFKKIVFLAVGAYTIIAFIGLYLAKLFIYPIQNQRNKLNTFVKNATHELNTPISALLLCADSNNFYNEKNRNLVKISAKKISNLYKDIEYISLRRHQIKTPKEVDISEILKKELIFHSSIAAKKSINLIFNTQITLLKIDEDDFARLVNNLISNAIKYTKRGGSVFVTLKENKLYIKDDGIGIAKENLSKVFHRYYRATDDVVGFGIGLDIVQSICKAYNIRIEIKSEQKEGTTCILTFTSA